MMYFCYLRFKEQPPTCMHLLSRETQGRVYQAIYEKIIEVMKPLEIVGLLAYHQPSIYPYINERVGEYVLEIKAMEIFNA